MDKENGMSKLAGVMHRRMQAVAESPPLLELGSIGGDYSLTTDAFPLPIPASDYLVCRSAALGSAGSAWGETGASGDPLHTHETHLPGRVASIAPGDRVLVAWVGSDAVIIDRIVTGRELAG